MHFAVTSLSTAKPVPQAQIRLEGVRDDKFVTLAQGVTGADGAFTWPLEKRDEAQIKRVVVTKGLDTLVIEPNRAPAEYAHENWSKPERIVALLDGRSETGPAEKAAHSLPRIHRAPDLPPGRAGACERLCAQLSRRQS